MSRRSRYYTGVISRRTMCLALLASAAAAGQPPRAQPAPRGRRSPLFPVDSRWAITLDGPPSAPAAWDGTRAYIALRSGRLVAVSLDTGRIEWSVDLAIDRAPLVAEGLVIAAAAGAVRALSATDGSPRWQLPLGSPLSAPLSRVADRLVVGTASGDVRAVGAGDGRILWRQQYGAPLVARPGVDDVQTYLPLEDGRIVAAVNATGAEVWAQRLGGKPADAAAAAGRVYVGTDDNLLSCLSARTGRIEWHWRAGGDIVGAPVVDERRVYFVAMDHVLRALDRASGVQRWRSPLPERPRSGPILFAGLLLTAGIAPTIHAHDCRDGALVGSASGLGDLAGPPYARGGLIEADTTLYVLTGAGQLQALRAALTDPPALPTPPAPPKK